MTLPDSPSLWPVFLAFAVLALATLVPLLVVLRRAKTPRGRRDSALALHRAQLIELDRELAEGRIGAAEHAGAMLEVQRRLLVAADQPDAPTAFASRTTLVACLIVVPVAALILYLVGGHPELPGGSTAARVAEAAADTRQTDTLIDTLRQRLATMDPKSDLAAQGFLLLGNAEASRGHLAEAAAAWRKVLDVQFEPNLAAQTAEAEFQLNQKLTPGTRALFQRALDNAPPDAGWRNLVQQRLAGTNG